jgi:[ribosomal protein S5]-alanine N-acetyltransferase
MAAGTDLALAALKSTGEFLSMAGLQRIDCAQSEIGIWIRESAQGMGYGREVVAATMTSATARHPPGRFHLPGRGRE